MEPEIYRRMAEIEDVHWWFSARREIIDRLIRRAALVRVARIMEAGCGTGGNLPMLARHGAVYGMESDEGASAFAARRNCARVAMGRLPDHIPFSGIDFDLIVMTDVLEHLDDEVTCLNAVRARTKPGGWLLLTVPAFAWLWSGHDLAHHHIRRYAAPYLRAKVLAAGYTIDYISYFNSLLFAPIAVARVARRLTPSAASRHDLQMPPRIVNATLRRLFELERSVIGRFSIPFGVSLIALARN